jgi:bilirubin oxidase
LKDVVLLGEGETVTVIARYAPYDGVYMFHCHNLIHEDHDMMAAFNVTALSDFGYPETTRFLDPMEDRWRAKPISGSADSQQALFDKCALFESLEAYTDAPKLEKALEDYYDKGMWRLSTLQTVVSSSASAGSSADSSVPAATSSAAVVTSKPASATITSAPKATSTKKKDDDDDKKKTTTTKKK